MQRLPLRPRSRWVAVLVFFVYSVVGFLAYLPALMGPFQFDDLRVVLDPSVRERRSLAGFMLESARINHDAGGPLGTRALPAATILWQWQVWGKKTGPYHVFNVGVHVVSAWLVWVLLRQLLGFSSAGSASRPSRVGREFWLAVFGGGVFLLHPLQTQAVAYISQRYESMMGMFFLLSVTAYLRARKFETLNPKSETNSKLKNSKFKNFFWYGISLLAGFCAMSSKETAVVLPGVILAIEILNPKFPVQLRYGASEIRNQFNPSTSLRARIQNAKFKIDQKWLLIGLFFLLALKVPVQVILGGNFGGHVPQVNEIALQAMAVEQAGKLGMTRENYFLTQFGVIVTYIRMLIFPYGQSIDHDVPLVNTLWQWPALPALVVLLGLWGLAVWLWRRATFEGETFKGMVALGIGWFFITLAVTSSIIPIRDVLYEHRLYLPMVGWVLVLVIGLHKTYNDYKDYKSYMTVGSSLLLAVYFVLTLWRSSVWASEVTLWEDAWKKAPQKDRTNKNYGFVLTQAGRLSEGIVRLEHAVQLNPEDQDYRITLGAAYLQAQAGEKARREFEIATLLPPDDNSTAWNNLGVALWQLGQDTESKKAFETALGLNPDDWRARENLGKLLRRGR